jgi:beta-N-acetylhexosaminidase
MTITLQEAQSYAAELVILGFSGTTLSSETLKTLQYWKPAHFILFAQNYESPDQLMGLTQHLQSLHASDLPVVISVDQEGGRVQRFRSGFTLLPSAAKIAAKNSPVLTYELARVQARELFAAGIQLNFAPVADINTNPSNPVIGDRAYGDQPSSVAQQVTAVVRGHQIEHMECALKHFPGHGDTHLDSHFDLPTVTTDLETLRNREWIPFIKGLNSGAKFVMSAHILLPHLDEKYPGTLSSLFLKKYLRSELQFKGIIVSDDMQMHAITKNYGAEEAPLLALKAGCDLLCYRSEDQAVIAMEAITRALLNQTLNKESVLESIQRTRKVRDQIQLAEHAMTNEQRLSLIGSSAHADFVNELSLTK